MANTFYEQNPDLAAFNEWASKNANNDSVKGLANDLFYNYASANLQARSDTDYAKQMMPLSLDFQRGQQSIATQADLQRLAAEGDLVRGLTEQQGRFANQQKEIEAGAARYGADRQLNIAQQQRYGAADVAGIQGQTERDVAGTQAGAQRYLAEQQRYGATDVAGIQGQTERDVAGTQAGAQRYLAEQQRYGAENVAGIQGHTERDVAGTQAAAQRYLAEQQRYGATDVAGIQGQTERDVAGTQAGAQRYLAEQQRYGATDVANVQAGAQRYLAEQQRGGAREVAEIEGATSRDVARTQADANRYGFDSQERQIGLTGEQERRNKQQDTTEQLRLRADARGAIRTAGRTFYG